MTEEEIRPIAEQYVEEYCHCSDGEYTDGSLICAGIGTALIVARRLEKKNAELREQIEKMKVQHFTDIRLYTKVIGIAVEESVMKDKQNYKNYLFDKAKKILSMGVDK